ncbi:hypothetical protein [Thalassotalea profundi]|uniref:hypothetical protein n=1 Tax=Thalassotalea profundi TaxID=2036687 RepID=UPI001675C779|nr:hypothetical protein [Thalassotalea profundi]
MEKSLEFIIPFVILFIAMEAVMYFQLKKGIKSTLGFGLLIAVIISIIYFIFTQPVAHNDRDLHYFFVLLSTAVSYLGFFAVISTILIKINNGTFAHICILLIAMLSTPVWWIVLLLFSCFTGYDCF